MTKTLYLVRHAKSSWKDESLADYDRPLNKRGKQDAPEMGRRLAEKNIVPDLIISSPAKRAKRTALAIAQEIDYPKRKIQWEEELYHATTETFLEWVQQTNDSNQSLMIVGHNPYLTDFQNRLSDEAIDNIVTAGIACVLLEVDEWQEVTLSNNKGKLEWYDYPKRIQS